jgi:hypothetical protein
MAISTAAFGTASDGTNKSTYTPSRNPNIGVSYSSDYSGIQVNQAIGGEVYTVERFGKRKGWSLNYTFLNSTDQGKLQALVDYADGRKTVFYFSEDDFGTSGTKVRFDQDSFSFEEVAQGATSITFTLLEQL